MEHMQMSPLATSVIALSNSSKRKETKHKRRYCKYEGCNRIVKSQGLCQRHGAQPRKCKIEGCNKQSQGNFNCMCKAHFKELHMTEEVSSQAMKVAHMRFPASSALLTMPVVPSFTPYSSLFPVKSVCETVLLKSIGWSPVLDRMPLMAHLKQGFEISTPEAHNRNEEHQVLVPDHVCSFAQDLDSSSELKLALLEALALTRSTGALCPHSMATAWDQARDLCLCAPEKEEICACNLQVPTESIENFTNFEMIYDKSLVDDIIEIFLPKKCNR